MSEPFLVEHVVAYRARRHTVFGCEGKPCLPVNKTPNQPGGRAAINTRPRPRHPHSALVALRIDLADSSHCIGRTLPRCLFQKFLYALLQPAVVELDLSDLIESIPKPAKATRVIS